MPTSYKHKIYIPTSDIQNANMRAEHPVKSQISVNYNGANIAFDVLDYDKHDLVDKDTTKTMCVCSHDIISYGTIPFDAPQLMYYTEGGLPAGNYKFTLDHATYGGGTQYDGTYMFTLTQAIPADGGFRHKNIGDYKESYTQGDVIGNYITTYGVRPQRAEVEKDVSVNVWDGTTACTDLGTFTARSRTYYVEDDAANGGKRNFTERQAYASNRWRDSVVRQWLNSDAEEVPSSDTTTVSNWWKPATVFDTLPSGAKIAGFLNGLDSEFVSTLGEIEVKTALCNCDRVDGATYDITHDKVWLQSMTEVFGDKNNSIAEGSQLAYWVGASDVDRIKYEGSTARYWWLRSPDSTIADLVYDISLLGYIYKFHDPRHTNGIVPTFCIKQYDGGMKPVVSYKRKLYMGRSIEWNQLVDKSKFWTTTTIGGVTFTNNRDGTITVNGTAQSSDDIYYSLHNTIEVSVGHKILISGGVTGAGWSSYLLYDASDATHGIDSPGGGKIYTVRVSSVKPFLFVAKGYTVSNLVFKPQLFDLTQMFGAGNEPSTPAEFWTYFDHKVYPYNPGETQPLFKISRKSQWGALPKHYTARWDKVNAAMVRLNDAASFSTDVTNFAYRGSVNANYSNPFDNIYPWSGIKLCNISIDLYRNLVAGDSITKCVTAWEGDANFSYNDANGVWRYRPEFWGKSWEDDTYRYFDVTDQNVHGSNYVHYPEAIVGRWHGRNETLTIGGAEKTCLVPSVGMPAKRIAMSTLHTYAKNYGATIDSIYSIDADTLLCIVEFATMNTQNAIGEGVSDLYRQSSDLIQEDVTNSTTVKVLAEAGSTCCIPGAIFDIGTSNGGNQVGSFTVVSATPNVVDAQYLDVTLDRAVTATTTNYWSVHGLVNVADEAIGSKSGYIGENGKSIAYYRGEELFGNMFFYILGAYRQTGTQHVFIAHDDNEADAADALNASLHIDTGIALSTTEGYVKKLGILSRSGLLCCPPFCTEKGGNPANPVGDYYYSNASAGNTVLICGGLASDGVGDGAFYGLWGEAASSSNWNYAARPRLKNPLSGLQALYVGENTVIPQIVRN